VVRCSEDLFADFLHRLEIGERADASGPDPDLGRWLVIEDHRGEVRLALISSGPPRNEHAGDPAWRCRWANEPTKLLHLAICEPGACRRDVRFHVGLTEPNPERKVGPGAAALTMDEHDLGSDLADGRWRQGLIGVCVLGDLRPFNTPRLYG
jgi:hypothetical protein